MATLGKPPQTGQIRVAPKPTWGGFGHPHLGMLGWSDHLHVTHGRLVPHSGSLLAISPDFLFILDLIFKLN
jgi:hypothetical protein